MHISRGSSFYSSNLSEIYPYLTLKFSGKWVLALLSLTNYSASAQRPIVAFTGSIPGISNPRNGKASTELRDLQPDTTNEKKIREEGLTPGNLLL